MKTMDRKCVVVGGAAATALPMRGSRVASRVTIQRCGGACSGEVFEVLLDGRSLGNCHSQLVAATIKAGIEKELQRREAA